MLIVATEYSSMTIAYNDAGRKSKENRVIDLPIIFLIKPKVIDLFKKFNNYIFKNIRQEFWFFRHNL